MEQPKQSDQIELLKDIFKLQEELNDGIFKKKDIRDNQGQLLTMAAIKAEVVAGKFGPLDLPNVWLRRYLEALTSEAVELKESTLWKFWAKSSIDIQNARVEIIDMLHFLVSLALASNLTAEECHRLYTLKHRVNEQRQENNYSLEGKNEADNKTVI